MSDFSEVQSDCRADEIQSLKSELAAAQRECAELRKDKERLDWLGTRRHIAWSFAFQGGELTPTSVVQHPTKESLRTAIDAAMKGQK